MPEAYTHWECCTCGKSHNTYDEAHACETNHIVEAATDGFKARLDDILSKGKRHEAR